MTTSHVTLVMLGCDTQFSSLNASIANLHGFAHDLCCFLGSEGVDLKWIGVAG